MGAALPRAPLASSGFSSEGLTRDPGVGKYQGCTRSPESFRQLARLARLEPFLVKTAVGSCDRFYNMAYQIFAQSRRDHLLANRELPTVISQSRPVPRRRNELALGVSALQDLKVGDNKGQVIVDRPSDHKLADALQNLFRQSLAFHWTFLDFFNQSVDPVLSRLRLCLNYGVRK
jgi:hypothetical protein